MVVLMDPMEDPDDILRANRSREKTYMFDVAFDYTATQASLFCVFFFCLCMFARADQFEAHVYTDFNMLYVLTPLCAFMASVKRVLNVFSLGRGVQIHH